MTTHSPGAAGCREQRLRAARAAAATREAAAARWRCSWVGWRSPAPARAPTRLCGATSKAASSTATTPRTAAALRKLEELIAAGDAHDKLRGYYGGLLAFRRAQLAAPGGAAAQGGTPAHYAQRCVSELDSSLALEAEFAEALALRAACLAEPLEVGGGYAPLSGHRARKDLERARQLATRNPRVLLVDAMNDYALAPSQGGNKDRALGKLRQTVAAFEAERSAADHLPGWGAAEAWLLLAQDLLDHGDTVGARDALEHALLIAPEFVQARRLMTKITSG